MHINEAQKFGIEKLILSKNQKVEKNTSQILRFGTVYELLALFND